MLAREEAGMNKTEVILFRAEEGTAERLKEVARDSERSMAAVIRYAIRHFLQEEQRPRDEAASR